jgi:hypothetical protein
MAAAHLLAVQLGSLAFADGIFIGTAIMQKC